MAGNNTAAFGIYRRRAQAERTIDPLLTAGFLNNDILVLQPDVLNSNECAHEKNTHAPEGTVADGTLSIGRQAILGFGPFIATGPITAPLAGSGVRGRESIEANV
jgi:hypothetical protein